MNQVTTACPLDCYDACRVVLDENGKLKGDKSHPITQGYLCPNLNHFSDYSRIESPRLKGKEISMEEALGLLTDAIRSNKPDSLLYYRGSGNVALMQRCTEHFFAEIGAVGTSGSLCDGAGEAGIIAGRGKNYVLSPQMLEESEVVILWGRNPHSTHSHLLPFLEGKQLIVIDPVRTSSASKADLHIQIKPRGDLYLALLLSRFAIIEGMHDKAWLDEYASGYEEYYELTQTVRIKATLDMIDVSLGEIGSVLAMVEGKKTAILVGAGVQKYRNGAEVLRAIDGFAALLGLFGKEGCGVSFLGDSGQGIDTPFKTTKNRISKATADFSKYNCVFVQGANPLAQMPNSNRVRESFRKAGLSVYFGLYENETSQAADLVIPAKTFLEKHDFRSSYGDYTLQEMAALIDSGIGISEYALSAYLCEAFSVPLESEAFYLEHFRSQIEYKEGTGYRRGIPELPYEEGFENDEFEFLDEIDQDASPGEGYYLVSPKYARSLNSQFNRPEGVYVHPETGFAQGEQVRLSTLEGSVVMEARHDDRLRNDTILIYSGTPDVNVLTPAWLSYEGENAVYQELKIKVEKL